MSELGQVLQRAREEKGITLDDIQRITKIQRRYLEAIERGHFHVLPGHFYARAFIKSYAEAVGLDPNHILTHFQADLPAQPPTEQVERLRRRRVASANNPLQAGRWVTKTLLVLFIALIIGVIYVAAVNNNDDTFTQPIPSGTVTPGAEIVTPGNGGGVSTSPIAQQPQPPSAVTPVTEPGTTTPEPEVSQATVTFESQQGSIYNYSLQGGEKITVHLKVKEDRSWFGVSEGKGKKYVEEGELKKGAKEEITIELKKSAYVRLGKPTVVELTVNGAVIDTSKMKFMPSNITIKLKEAAAQ
ncbi:helix-turn-helix domain-containing protein [Brevibacillus gelatini]|uniref:Helix-turn-helix domain-containing protein n=1 Tax=Brevibacillus gelatini TaxID=1655277 RepID=A0A3M8B8K4_9BACL|nr:helix-turn-helix domain-containing protein [Brevibacillus gelatini]RNB59781.1 helix-turn-helix domain-containing protein [Brevibacillus gelatini]